MTTRLRCMPLPEADEGMSLAAPLMLTEHGVISFQLPVGHVLTRSNLDQMRVRRAEYVCILEEDPRDAEEVAQLRAAAEDRLHHIFRAADQSEPVLADLYDALLAYRRSSS